MKINLGFFGTLGIAFIVLKLCGVIQWSWWWVTAPLWGGIALMLIFMLFMLIFMGFVAMFFLKALKNNNVRFTPRRF